MYGPASSDLVNARMADHRRNAQHVALENAARRSQRVERTPKPSWYPDFIAFAAAAGRSLAGLRKRAAVPTTAVASRLNSATN